MAGTDDFQPHRNDNPPADPAGQARRSRLNSTQPPKTTDNLWRHNQQSRQAARAATPAAADAAIPAQGGTTAQNRQQRTSKPRKRVAQHAAAPSPKPDAVPEAASGSQTRRRLSGPDMTSTWDEPAEEGASASEMLEMQFQHRRTSEKRSALDRKKVSAVHTENPDAAPTIHAVGQPDISGLSLDALDNGYAKGKWNSSHGGYVNNTYATRSASSRSTGPVVALIAVVAIIAIAAFILLNLANALGGNSDENTASQENMNVQDTQETQEAAESTEPVKVTLSFAGDCTLGTDETFDYDTSFNAAYEAKPAKWFFANVADIFKKDSLTIVNMEGTLTEETSRADKTFAFKGKAKFAKTLSKGNVEAACLANNHSHDYGDKSYTDTIEAVEAKDIKTFGYDRIAYFDVDGVKVALIGTYVLDEGTGIISSMENNIKKAQDEGAQIIAVFTHWGTELDTVADETQMKVGHAAIDAGATLVVGGHPHVIQGYERYKDRYIVYSLGNFCFGGNANPTDMDCMIFQQTFTVEDGKVAEDDDIETIPCRVSSESSYNNYQPTPATGSEKKRIQEKIDESSEAIQKASKEMQS